MPLTPEQQRQLEALRAEQGASIGPSNPQAQRVETPPEGSLLMYQQAQADDLKANQDPNNPTITPYEQQTPAQRGVTNAQLGGVAGATVGNAPAEVVGAAGRAVSRFGGKLGAYLAGLGPKGAETYMAAPRTTEALMHASPARQVQFSNAATEGVSNRLANRNEMIEGGLQDYLQGKRVPESAVPPEAAQYFDRGNPSGNITGDVTGQGIDAPQLLGAVRQAGEEAKFADNPTTPFGDRARAKEAGRAWSGGRQAMSEHLPDFDPYMQAKEEVINAQKGLSPGAAALETKATDPSAARQTAEGLVGSTRLSRSANQLQTAQDLAEVPKKAVPRVVKDVGINTMRASSMANRAGQAIDPLAQFLSRGGTAASTSYAQPQVDSQGEAPSGLDANKRKLLEELRREQGNL